MICCHSPFLKNWKVTNPKSSKWSESIINFSIWVSWSSYYFFFLFNPGFSLNFLSYPMMTNEPTNQDSPNAPYLKSPSKSIMNFASLEISWGRNHLTVRMSLAKSGSFYGSLYRLTPLGGYSLSTYWFPLCWHCSIIYYLCYSYNSMGFRSAGSISSSSSCCPSCYSSSINGWLYLSMSLGYLYNILVIHTWNWPL